MDIPAITSLACPCGPHSFKGTPESLRVFQPSEQEERKVKKKLSNIKKKEVSKSGSKLLATNDQQTSS